MGERQSRPAEAKSPGGGHQGGVGNPLKNVPLPELGVKLRSLPVLSILLESLYRRDQRTVWLRSPDCRFVPVPSRPHPLLFANRVLVTSEHPQCATRAARFRLRLGRGRCATVSFRYALHSTLRSTRPAPRPQTEANSDIHSFVQRLPT